MVDHSYPALPEGFPYMEWKREAQTQNGKWVRTSPVSYPIRVYWKQNKEACKAAALTMTCYKEKWYLNQWQQALAPRIQPVEVVVDGGEDIEPLPLDTISVVPRGMFLEVNSREIGRVDLQKLLDYSTVKLKFFNSRTNRWDEQPFPTHKMHGSKYLFPMGMKNELLPGNYQIPETMQDGARVLTLDQYQKDAIFECCRRRTGLIVSPTGSGKTLMIAAVINVVNPSSVLILTERGLLTEQDAVNVARMTGREFTVVMKGMLPESTNDNIVCTVQTMKKWTVERRFEMLIVDEAHHSGAPTYRAIMEARAMDTARIYGFTATPSRSGDDMSHWMKMLWGHMITVAVPQDLIDLNRLCPVKLHQLKYEHEGNMLFCNEEDTYLEQRKLTLLSKNRNTVIVDEVIRQFNDGEKILVDVSLIKQGNMIYSMLRAWNVPAFEIYGQKTTCWDGEKRNRLDILQLVANHEGVLVSTLIKEGIDLPALSAVFFVGGGKSESVLVQTVGRALRVCQGKTMAHLYNVMDREGNWEPHHSRKRQALLEKIYPQRAPEASVTTPRSLLEFQ